MFAECNKRADDRGFWASMDMEGEFDMLCAILISLCWANLETECITPRTNKLNICTDYTICPRDYIPVNE